MRLVPLYSLRYREGVVMDGFLYFLILLCSFYRTICLRTEGYQAIDIKVLVNRAISNAEQRSLIGRLGKRKTESFDPARLLNPPVLFVELKDFMIALDSYVPASLKGLSLHKSGNINFNSVGGLMDAKTTLQETLLWPSKVWSLK